MVFPSFSAQRSAFSTRTNRHDEISSHPPLPCNWFGSTTELSSPSAVVLLQRSHASGDPQQAEGVDRSEHCVVRFISVCSHVVLLYVFLQRMHTVVRIHNFQRNSLVLCTSYSPGVMWQTPENSFYSSSFPIFSSSVCDSW